MVIIYVKHAKESMIKLKEQCILSWSSRMKNNEGSKLVSIEDRKEKIWTVIVLSHFSNELVGFLSNAATVENLQFTQRKEELGIFKENEVKAILDAIHALKDEEDVIRKTFTDSGHVDWVSGKYFDFEVSKVTFE